MQVLGARPGQAGGVAGVRDGRIDGSGGSGAHGSALMRFEGLFSAQELSRFREPLREQTRRCQTAAVIDSDLDRGES